MTKKKQPAAEQDLVAELAKTSPVFRALRTARDEFDAWHALATNLRTAGEDPVIRRSASCSSFVAWVAEVARVTASDSLLTSERAPDAWARLETIIASARARERNAAAREWVIEQWKAQAASYGGNKTLFATDYGCPERVEAGGERGLVWKKFAERVTTRTIRERWLKGV